jgi:Domain of unknown function (DUF4082)
MQENANGRIGARCRARRFALAVLTPSACWSGASCLARQQSALIADPDAPTAFLLNAGRTAGWQFTVNATLQVTNLGVYDAHADGLQIAYSVGIWNSSGALLTTAIVPNGIAATYADGFRYVPAASALLAPGDTYTIGYFASTAAPNDTMISQSGFHTVDPMVSQLPGSVVTPGAFAQLTMPTSSFGFETWVGPSFQFTVVPAPAAWIGLGTMLFSARRRRRA